MVLLIEQKVTAHEKPKVIFYAAVEHLAVDRSISPNRSLQDLILDAIARFRARQLALIEKHMTTDIASALEALLGEDDGAEAVKRHRLTILKQNTQSVRPMVIKARVANHADLAKLFHQVEPIVAVLGWDLNSMRAYALAVMKSDVHDVRRRKTSDRQMHLIAFVAYQYYNLQDNLVATLLSSVKAAENSAAREFKDWCFAERKSQAAKLKARIQAFEVHFQTAMATLQSVFDAADLSDTDKLTSLRLLLFPVDAQPGLSDEILQDIKETTASSETDDAQYFHILEARSRRLQNQVSGALTSLAFRAESHIKPLLAALDHFRKVDGQVTRSGARRVSGSV